MHLTLNSPKTATASRVQCDARLILGRRRGSRCVANARFYDRSRQHNLCGVHAQNRPVVEGVGTTWASPVWSVWPGEQTAPYLYETAGELMGRNVPIDEMTPEQLREYERSLEDWEAHVAAELAAKRAAIAERRQQLARVAS